MVINNIFNGHEIFIDMGKRVEFTDSEILKIISMYQDDALGTPTIGGEFGVDKRIINRVLRENGVTMGKSGRKYRGGKSEADKRYYETNKGALLAYHANWREDNKDKLREYHSGWRKDNQDKVKVYAKNYNQKIQSDPKLKLIK